MQTSNISKQNAFMRFSLGTTMAAMGIARYSRNPSCNRARAMIVIGAMKMAEGVFKYCPTKALMQNSMQSSVQNVFTPENPNMAKIIQDFAKIVSSSSTAQSNNSSSNSSGNTTGNAITAVANVASSESNLASHLANNDPGTVANGRSTQNTSTNKTVTNSNNKSSQASAQKNQTASATNPS